jgi:spore maturation protein CgeB
MKLVVLGLSITSSWGNGHATTFRGLLREMRHRGHEIVFLERDVPWYAQHRDLPNPVFCATRLYRDLDELRRVHTDTVATADAVILGSYVPDGALVAEWLLGLGDGIKAFYDIDTPVTLARLARGEHDYLRPSLIPEFNLYLSFTGGPTLERLEREYAARRARVLYCSVDERLYRPVSSPLRWDLGYLGTYSQDRQPKLDQLLLETARQHPERRFVVAGPQYPEDIAWSHNVERLQHLPPPQHPGFYAAQRFTLNVTRADMVAAGWSPSVRLFEAASCGVPIIGDSWPGLEELLRPGVEMLVAETGEGVARILVDTIEADRAAIAAAARQRVLSCHSSAARAAELEGYLLEAGRERQALRRAVG